MRRIEHHKDIDGSTRKEVVMLALQLIKGRVPEERREEIEMLIGLASDLVESVIMFAKAVRPVLKKKGCWVC
jgi:5-carboxymethyl-2-hydroxymuconate isomerase